jgi:hypothetical protein
MATKNTHRNMAGKSLGRSDLEYRKPDDSEVDVKNIFYEVGRKDLVEQVIQLQNLENPFERLSAATEFDFAPSDSELSTRELVPYP